MSPVGKTPPVLTLIGAGSRVFGFTMCTDIGQTPVLRGAEIRLVDVDARKLDDMRRLFQIVSQSRGMDLRISATTDRCEALPGSDAVILSVAMDRIRRWDMDLEAGRRNGIVETQGECGGPGGLSLTLRNVPLALEIARDIERLAPAALVLNFSNPMTRICRALTRYTRLRVVGLCHGVLEAQNRLQKMLGRPVLVRGFGINHFHWIREVKDANDGTDLWPMLRQAMSEKTPRAWKYTRELFEIFGQLVTPDDGHITDFLHHWRVENGLVSRYELRAKNMEDYRRDAQQWEERVNAYLDKRRDPMADVHGLSGEGAIPILTAYRGMTEPYAEISVNIPNGSCMEGLPAAAVVEMPAHISCGSVRGESCGALPTAIRSLVARQLDIAELAIEAAVERNREKALQALAIDPIVTDLLVARRYLDDILNAHEDILGTF
jgi:alpha-galactosidase